MFLYAYNCFDAFVFCVVIYLIYALINICSFDARTTPTHFAHTVSCQGPYTRVHGNKGSEVESIVMLSLRLA